MYQHNKCWLDNDIVLHMKANHRNSYIEVSGMISTNYIESSVDLLKEWWWINEFSTQIQ